MKTKIKLKVWQKRRPSFPCLFVCRNIYKGRKIYDYGIHIIEKIKGKNEKGEEVYYLGLFDGYGDEWRDLKGFKANSYFIIEKL